MLGAVCDINPETLSDATSNEYQFHYVDLSCVKTGLIAVPSEKVSFGAASSRARRKIREGDVLLSTVRPNLQGFAIVKREHAHAIVSTGFAVLRTRSQADSNYILQTLLSDSVTQQISDVVAGSNYPAITSAFVSSIKIPLPPLPEQRLIASILSTWDRAIEFTEKAIAAKRQRKDALLQRLVHRTCEKMIVKLGELFTNQNSKGRPGIPTYSVTRDRGLIPRDTLDRKNDTTLEPAQHLLIEKGDIAYNMMRMWQGASGLATESGLVSPAYVVIRSRGKVDPAFASYWFKMPRVVKKFQDYSHGLTKDRLRLYYKDFASIALPVPPLKLQQKIAKAMHCCDRELDALERKVKLLKLQKKGLMQKLLTGQVRVKLPKGAK